MALTSSPLTICLILIGIFAGYNGQKLKPGMCPALNSSPAPTLTIGNLVATWRVIGRTPNIHRNDWKCETYTFTQITANTKYTVTIAGVQKIALFNSGLGSVSGTVTVTGANGANSSPGTYFTFNINFAGKTTSLNYYIVLTDNTNYIVLYACENFLLGKVDSLIVLAKAGTPEASITTALNSLATFGLSRADLIYPFTAECI